MGQIVEVNLSDIARNNYNPNVMSEEKRQELKKSMNVEGLKQPIKIRGKVTVIDGREVPFEIVDGEHRFDIAVELGWKTIKAIIEDLTDALAMRECYVVNSARGSLDMFKEAMFFDLLAQTGLHEKQIAGEYNISEKFVKERRQLLSINAEQKELLLKKIPRGTELSGAHWLVYAKANPEVRIQLCKNGLNRYSPLTVRDMQDFVEQAEDEIESKIEFDAIVEKAKVKECPTCNGKPTNLNWEKRLECEKNHDWDPLTGATKQKIIGSGEFKEKTKRSKFPRTILTTLTIESAAAIAQEKVLKLIKTISNITFHDSKNKVWTIDFPAKPYTNGRLKVSNDAGYFLVFEDKKKIKIEVPFELNKKNYDATVETVKWLGGKIIERKKKGEKIAEKK